MNFVRLFLALSLGLSLTACNLTGSKKHEAPREPAAHGDHSQDTHLPADQIASLKQSVETRNPALVKQALAAYRSAQVLVFSFDRRLKKAKRSEDVDKLMSSQLFCDLQKTRQLLEKVEDKLRILFATALQQGAGGKEWIYNEFRQFTKLEPISEVAMMQAVRMLAEDEVAYCGAKDCFTAEAQKWPEFSIDPMNDRAMLKFVANLREVRESRREGVSATTRMEDAKPGDCFGDSRAPNQVGAYDWKNRNWIGSILPQGHFVFTYDDGPHATFTKEIRDTWERGGMAKPAFFWLTKNVANLTSIVTEMAADGYVIGSHSADHKDLGSLARAGNAKALDYQINGSVESLSKTLGKPVRYFRLPYGSGVKQSLIGDRFQALNVDHFFWRVDSLDWQDKNPLSIHNRVVAQMKATGRGIVLFHDIHSQSAKAAQMMVDFLKTNPNYKAVSIMELPGLQK